MTILDEAQFKFYGNLHALQVTLSEAEKLVSLSEFNACLRTNYFAWREELRPHEIAGPNDHGLLRLRTCSVYRLLLINILIRLPMRTASWVHTRSRSWQLLDYAPLRRRDRQNVMVTNGVCNAVRWTDHRLVIHNLGFHL
ncbi:hypothetical protein SprV_0100306100 [Sparganum proliferum]